MTKLPDIFKVTLKLVKKNADDRLSGEEDEKEECGGLEEES